MALHNFYVTFGMKYRYEAHPYWPGAHPDGWLEVIAPDAGQAAILVHQCVGNAYAFMYPADRFEPKWHPMGRLATLTQDAVLWPREGVEPPTPRFTSSDPEWYGHASDEVMCARIEGVLLNDSDTDCVEALGYEAEHVHHTCFQAAMNLFAEVTDVDYKVLAGELDWSTPYPCPVCEESIT